MYQFHFLSVLLILSASVWFRQHTFDSVSIRLILLVCVWFSQSPFVSISVRIIPSLPVWFDQRPLYFISFIRIPLVSILFRQCPFDFVKDRFDEVGATLFEIRMIDVTIEVGSFVRLFFEALNFESGRSHLLWSDVPLTSGGATEESGSRQL